MTRRFEQTIVRSIEVAANRQLLLQCVRIRFDGGNDGGGRAIPTISFCALAGIECRLGRWESGEGGTKSPGYRRVYSARTKRHALSRRLTRRALPRELLFSQHQPRVERSEKRAAEEEGVR